MLKGVLSKGVVGGSSTGLSGGDPSNIDERTEEVSDNNEDCVSTDNVRPREEDESLGNGKLEGDDTSERLLVGSGGVIVESTDRGMVLRRSNDEKDSVGLRKDVSPEVSGASCNAIEPTEGEAPRMDESYVPLDARPQLRRLERARDSGVRFEDDVKDVSVMLLLSSDGASYTVDSAA